MSGPTPTPGCSSQASTQKDNNQQVSQLQPQPQQEPVPSTSKGFKSSLKTSNGSTKKTKKVSIKQTVQKNDPAPPPTRIPNPDVDSDPDDPESSKPYDYSPVLSTIMNEKKLALMSNPEVLEFLSNLQGNNNYS